MSKIYHVVYFKNGHWKMAVTSDLKLWSHAEVFYSYSEAETHLKRMISEGWTYE